jgi:hypothetical protein
MITAAGIVAKTNIVTMATTTTSTSRVDMAIDARSNAAAASILSICGTPKEGAAAQHHQEEPMHRNMARRKQTKKDDMNVVVGRASSLLILVSCRGLVNRIDNKEEVVWRTRTTGATTTGTSMKDL